MRYPGTPITVFLRSKELDEALSSLEGVTIIHGDFSDLSTIESLSASHAIVINAATSTVVPVTEAIIRGAQRTTLKGKKPILLHLSGAGNFSDDGKTGTYVPQSHPFDDSNPENVRSINAKMLPNGGCDELILQAAAAGELIAFFVCPGGIYGASSNHIGLSARSAGLSYAQTPGVWAGWQLQNVATLGFSPYVGPGSSVFRTIHVDDVVELMMLVYAKALETWGTYKPEDVFRHFYLCVDEQHTAKDIAQAFADVSYRRGKIAAPLIRSVAFEDAGIVAR
jgi:nucleoside-diphosphate-sugar epimerase